MLEQLVLILTMSGIAWCLQSAIINNDHHIVCKVSTVLVLKSVIIVTYMYVTFGYTWLHVHLIK